MSNQNEPFIYVKSEHRLVQVVLSKLLYVECVKDYLKLHIQDQRPVMTLLSMKTMEEHLPSPQFMRIHRSFIVQTRKIEFINKGSVWIAGDNIPISDGYRDRFLSYIESYILS